MGGKGGATNRKLYEANDREIPPPQNAGDGKNFLSEAMAGIRAGKKDPETWDDLGVYGRVTAERRLKLARLEKLEQGRTAGER